MNRNILAAALALASVAACGTAYAQTAPTGCTQQDPLMTAPAVGAIGPGATATGGASYAVGYGATASSLRAFAIGTNAMAAGTCSSAIGDSAYAGGLYSFAAGAGAAAVGQQSLAVGNNAYAATAADVAVGLSAYASGTSVAFGAGANADQSDATAVGTAAIAANAGDTAIGGNAIATGGNSTAVGSSAYAAGTASQAIGQVAQAIGAFSVADGPNTTAAGDLSVALGASSYADRDSAVSIGNDGTDGNGAFQRQLINLASGTEPFDAVNLQQLDAGGSAIAAWIGAGATFEAAGAGAFTSPMFVLSNPYTPGSYTTVSDALTALDTAVTDVSKQPGPVGPQGPQGPAGKSGNDGSGTGTDPLAVHYDDSTDAGATLRGADGTRIHNLADGIAPTDAANVSQVESALNQANAYTDLRIGQLDLRVNYALAAAAASANAAAAVAGQDPTHHNRVAVSDGLASGVNAWTAMYQHVNANGVTWNVSLTGEQGGGSSSERQVGVGIGYSW